MILSILGKCMEQTIQYVMNSWLNEETAPKLTVET